MAVGLRIKGPDAHGAMATFPDARSNSSGSTAHDEDWENGAIEERVVWGGVPMPASSSRSRWRHSSDVLSVVRLALVADQLRDFVPLPPPEAAPLNLVQPVDRKRIIMCVMDVVFRRRARVTCPAVIWLILKFDGCSSAKWIESDENVIDSDDEIDSDEGTN